jgi:hypothetical protein
VNSGTTIWWPHPDARPDIRGRRCGRPRPYEQAWIQKPSGPSDWREFTSLTHRLTRSFLDDHALTQVLEKEPFLLASALHPGAGRPNEPGWRMNAVSLASCLAHDFTRITLRRHSTSQSVNPPQCRIIGAGLLTYPLKFETGCPNARKTIYLKYLSYLPPTSIKRHPKDSMGKRTRRELFSRKIPHRQGPLVELLSSHPPIARGPRRHSRIPLGHRGMRRTRSVLATQRFAFTTGCRPRTVAPVL